MTLIAESRSIGILGPLAIAIAAGAPVPSEAEETYRIDLEIEALSPDARQAIVKALAPDSLYADLLQIPESPIEGERLLPDFRSRTAINAYVESYWQNAGGDSNSVFVTTVGNTNYVLIDRTSDISARLGLPPLLGPPIDSGSLPDFLATANSIPTLNESNAWALPIDSTLPSLPLPIGPTEFVPLVVSPTPADPVISRLDRELAIFGSSSLRLSISDDNRDEFNSLIEKLANSPGISVERVPDGALGPDVEQDLPEEVELLSASSGSCESSSADWPLPLSDVQGILNYNEEVLRSKGITSWHRSRILIIDSGVSSTLVHNPEFRLFLRPNSSDALERGYFWETVTNLDGQEKCDWAKGVSSFGLVTNPSSNICYAASSVGGLEPPQPETLPRRYLPDHGGFVGVLSAGGPVLIDNEYSLSSRLGIGFARVMSMEGGRLHSNDQDIAAAMEYARSGDYNVVNLSLSFADPDNSSTASSEVLCFISGGPCGDATSRLIVAAAGNVAKKLEQSSSSFPAMAAANNAFRKTEKLIVVGGVERVDGTLRPWPDTTFHRELVDILAPSSSVPSLDRNGRIACMSGTSVAAPQVSFVAGMLFSLGYKDGAEVRARILSTADYLGPANEEFMETAKDGRVLNVSAALDVFSDLIYVKSDGNEVMLRGQLLPDADDLRSTMIALCEASDPALKNDNGKKDPDQFTLWRSLDGSSAEVWAEGISLVSENKCQYDPEAKIRFRAHSEERSKVYKLSELSRIVPSHFRRAFEVP